MKKPSTELYELIQNLTPQDKVNFKVYIKKHGNHANQIQEQLFNHISAQKVYDEETLLKNIEGKKTKKWLTTAKVRLYNMILRSLNYYDTDFDSEISNLIQSTKILNKKGLYKQAYSTIQKAKKTAYQFEKFEYLPFILEVERTLISRLYYKEKRHSEHKALSAEYKLALKNLQELSQYITAMHLSISYGYTQGFARSGKELKALEKQLIIPDSTVQLTDRAKIYYYAAYSNYYRLAGNNAKSYEFSKKTVEAIENRKDLIKESTRMYVASLHNHVLHQQESKRFDEAKHTLQKLKNILPGLSANPKNKNGQIPGMTETEISATLESIFMIETDQYILTGEFKEGASQIKSINKVLENQSLLRSGNKIVSAIIHYNFAYLYFGAGQYEDALFWLNKLLNEEHEYLQEDLHAITRVVNLIFHYELGHEEVLEYFVRSTYRFLYKRKRLYQLEETILTFIRKKMPLVKNDKDVVREFSILKKELEKIAENPYQKRVMEHFDFISWLESKISGKPFATAFKERIFQIHHQ